MSVKNTGYLLLLTAIAPIIWGSTYIVTSQWLPENTPLTAGLIRSLPAGILLVLLSKQWLSITPKSASCNTASGNWWLKAAVLGVLNVGLFFYCLFTAAYLMPGGVAAILISSQPLWAILLSVLILHNRLSVFNIAQCLIGMVGVGLLVTTTDVVLSFHGIAIALLGAVSMSFGVVYAKKWGLPESISLLGLTGWQLVFGGLFLLPLALWFEGVPNNLSVSNMLAYAYLAIPGAMIAYYLWFYGIQKLPTANVVVLSFLSPLTAVLLGYAFLDERLSTMQFAGAICIVLTLLLPLFSEKLRSS